MRANKWFGALLAMLFLPESPGIHLAFQHRKGHYAVFEQFVVEILHAEMKKRGLETDSQSQPAKVSYLKANPALWSLPGDWLVSSAVQKAFPCKK